MPPGTPMRPRPPSANEERTMSSDRSSFSSEWNRMRSCGPAPGTSSRAATSTEADDPSSPAAAETVTRLRNALADHPGA